MAPEHKHPKPTMKKIPTLGFAVLLIATLFSSCQKYIDRLPDHHARTKTEMLVGKNWEVFEVLRNIEGDNSHYIKDSLNTTTTDYSSIRLSFRADGTGVYIDEEGVSHSAVWKFTTADERNMELTISPPAPATFVWNLVEISDSSLSNTTAFGPHILVAARYTPVEIKK